LSPAATIWVAFRACHVRIRENVHGNSPTIRFSLAMRSNTLLDGSPFTHPAAIEASKSHLVSVPDLMYLGSMRHFISAFVVVLLVASCDYTAPAVSSEASSGEFIGGERKSLPCSTVCTCAEEKCAFECGANGCGSATCIAGDCTGTCGAAGCNFGCNSQSSCNYECPNGGCNFTCDQSNCHATCPAGGCTMNCNNGASCTLDCTGALGQCTLNCSGGSGQCQDNCSKTSCGG